MRLWSNYLTDYRQNPEGHADSYPHEVRYRVMLQLLMAEIHVQPSEQDSLSRLDSLLRANLTTGEFIWESDLQIGFPREVYWFLYGKLRS